MHRHLLLSLVPFLLAAPGLAGPRPPQMKPAWLLGLLDDELKRNLAVLKKEAVPPYFVSYTVRDLSADHVRASFGAVESDLRKHARTFAVEVRVGDYSLDNTHAIRGRGREPGYSTVSAALPIEDDEGAIREVLWRETDRAYKDAVERLAKVRTNRDVKVGEEDRSDDFSRESPERFVGEPVTIRVDRAAWRDRVKAWSARLLDDPRLLTGAASLWVTEERRWLVSSEGTSVFSGTSLARLVIEATTKADDGMLLPRNLTYASRSPDGLPPDEEVRKDVAGMMADLAAMRDAPQIDPYAGPAILSGRAAGVFFHEVFGHRVEGHRQKDEKEGQTFRDKVGQRILPDFLSVVFDPALRKVAGQEVVGGYELDDQGVRGRKVDVVVGGRFKGFLMSRSPVKGFPKSNGHGRGQAGRAPVARQSNLVVLAGESMPFAALKARLIEECRRQGKPYGLWFRGIEGGFTFTGREIPNAFNVIPTVVYRIHLDGREEMVRGADLIGTPLTALTTVIAASDRTEVFNGVCGAESGWVPVSASSPDLLLSQIEIQRKEKSQERLPILPPPPRTPGGRP
ncbi:MAG: hypothetical protein FJ087_03715 [Deltaproteobacteria bacterium]|nr:hypothetical protein [Deltaproteobacteria bacterium]